MSTDSQPRIYYNIEKRNDTTGNIEARYDSGSLQSALIKNASDYELSILRFRVPSSTIPILPDNIAYGDMVIGMDFSGTTITQSVPPWGSVKTPEYVYDYFVHTDGAELQTWHRSELINGQLVNRIQLALPAGVNHMYGLTRVPQTGIMLARADVPVPHLVKVNDNLSSYTVVDNIEPLDIQVDTSNNLIFVLGGIPAFNGRVIRIYNALTLEVISEHQYSAAGSPRAMALTGRFMYALQYNNGIASIAIYQYTLGLNGVMMNFLGYMTNPTSDESRFISCHGGLLYTAPYSSVNNTVHAWPATGELNVTVSTTYNFNTLGGGNIMSLTVTSSNELMLLFNHTVSFQPEVLQIAWKPIVTPLATPATFNITSGVTVSSGLGLAAPAYQVSTLPIYQIQELLYPINLAFQDMFNTMTGVYPAQFTGYVAPWIEFDPSTKLFSFYAPKDLLAGFYLNPLLYRYFNPLSPAPDASGGVLNGFYRMLFVDSRTNELTVNGKTYLRMTQEGSSLAIINQLNKIVIKTNTMPVIGDITSNIAESYISDYSIDTSNFIPGEALILYPTLMRLYSMYSNRELRQVDVQVYYGTTTSDELRILEIPPGENFSIKLEFRNKYLGGSSF